MCKGQDNQPKRGKKWKPKRLTRTAKTAKDSARRVTEPRLFFAVTRNWDATKRLKSKYQKGESHENHSILYQVLHEGNP
jgi:hypothetical protein